LAWGINQREHREQHQHHAGQNRQQQEQNDHLNGGADDAAARRCDARVVGHATRRHARKGATAGTVMR